MLSFPRSLCFWFWNHGQDEVQPHTYLAVDFSVHRNALTSDFLLQLFSYSGET